MNQSLPLVVLVGPTAVGKTKTAIQLAVSLDGEIVSTDSRLFYRGMDIGTVKPTPDELAQIPHHLIDVADPDQIWSLAIFQKAAEIAIGEIHARGRTPFLVGGTGQYVKAIIGGWTPPPVEPNPELRNVLTELANQNTPAWLHDHLKILDPVAAEKIDPRNVRRTIRALEVILTSGRPFSVQRGKSSSPYFVIQIGLSLPRKDLYRRIDARIDEMFEKGLLDEVALLLRKGYPSDLPTMSAIGYQECVEVLKGNLSVEEAKIKMRKATRIYVRRQANWFKEGDPEIKWFSMDIDRTEEMIIYIQKCLTKGGTQ